MQWEEEGGGGAIGFFARLAYNLAASQFAHLRAISARVLFGADAAAGSAYEWLERRLPNASAAAPLSLAGARHGSPLLAAFEGTDENAETVRCC